VEKKKKKKGGGKEKRRESASPSFLKGEKKLGVSVVGRGGREEEKGGFKHAFIINFL